MSRTQQHPEALETRLSQQFLEKKVVGGEPAGREPGPVKEPSFTLSGRFPRRYERGHSHTSAVHVLPMAETNLFYSILGPYPIVNKLDGQHTVLLTQERRGRRRCIYI